MGTLRRLQRSLAAHVLRGAAVAPGLVVGTRSFRAAERLAVYREGYGLRLTEALAANYPVLQSRLGEAAFAQLSAAYVASAPSRSHTLRDLGHRLPAFLATHMPWRATPALGELARFEWAMAGAFDAPDLQALTVADLADIAPREWPRMRLRLHPSVRLLSQRWNAAASWSAVNRGESPPDFARSRPRQHWVLWRHELKVMFAAIDPQEWVALRALRRGARFAQICALLEEGASPALLAQRAAALLRGWVERGWIIGAVPAPRG